MNLVFSIVAKTLFLCALPFFYGLEWFRPIRIGQIIDDRIGHLASNTDLFLRRVQAGKLRRNCFYLFFASHTHCNDQLFAMFKRVMPICENKLARKVYYSIRSILIKTRFYQELPLGLRDYNDFGLGRASLKFTDEEHARGRRELQKMGVPQGAWFVCFHARDNSYLRNLDPKFDWSYHDYRNTSIGNFALAARYIVEQGGYAIRVGAKVDNPLSQEFVHPNIIDYASHFRSDFLDIYLMGTARFVVMSDSGLAQVATVFDVPSVNTNTVAIDWASWRADDIFIQKKMISKATQKFLPYSEIFRKKYDRFLKTEEFIEVNVDLVENTAQEILGATMEMHERLEGRRVYSQEDQQLQQRYRSLFTPEQTCYGFRSRIGRDFLRANVDTIFG